METWIVSFLDDCQLDFLNFLRGMETPARNAGLQTNVALPKLP